MDFKNFFQSGFVFEADEKEIKSKFILLNSIMVIGMTLGVAMFIVHWWNLISFSNKTYAITLVIYNSLSTLVLLYMRRSRDNFILCRNIFYGLSIAIISSDVILLDGEQARIAWYTVIIIPAFFLGGQRFGVIVLSWSIFLILLIYNTFNLSYMGSEVLYIIFFYLTIGVLISFYEKNRSALYEEIANLNENLEDRVAHLVAEEKANNVLLLKQARQAQMGEMIGVIAHQWKQPLGAISAATSSITFSLSFLDKEDRKSIDECEEFIAERSEAIMLYVQSLTDTMDDFRNFFSPNKVKDKNCSSGAVDKALTILENSLKVKNIRLEKVYETERKIELFSNEIMQVVLNIIKNAQDNFLDKEINDPRISIKVYDDKQYQKILISDNGGGIPDEHIESIFKSYYTTKSESEGTGIGLYMSTMIVEDHHQGLLSVHNINGGACFIIELPFYASLATHTPYESNMSINI